jgi:hypothetical protein
MALGLLVWPLGCVLSVDDGDDDDGFGGDGGSFSASGSGGDSGSGGAPTAGTGGTSIAGAGGSEPILAQTCEPEDGDELDECVQCLKQNCCIEWLECDDDDCINELFNVSECVQEFEFAGQEELGMCISDNSTANDGLAQPNTQALFDCALTDVDDGIETRCSSECFGSDIFLE